VAVSRAEIEGERARMEGEREAALAERDVAVGQVGSSAKVEYDRLCKKKAGVALVRIRNGCCGGCYQAVPPQKIAEAKLRKGIVYCEYCGRIVTWEEAGAGA